MSESLIIAALRKHRDKYYPPSDKEGEMEINNAECDAQRETVEKVDEDREGCVVNYQGNV